MEDQVKERRRLVAEIALWMVENNDPRDTYGMLAEACDYIEKNEFLCPSDEQIAGFRKLAAVLRNMVQE